VVKEGKNMAKLTKVRTRKRPRDTVLLDEGWEAMRSGKGWAVSGPGLHLFLVTVPMTEKQIGCVLRLLKEAYRTGRRHVQDSIRDALGLEET
jgi:hypothetical protein